MTQAQHRQGHSHPHQGAKLRAAPWTCVTTPESQGNLSCHRYKLLLPDILPHGHGCNNLLYSFFPLLFLFIVEFSLQFKNLSWQKTIKTQIEPLRRRKGSCFRDSSRVSFCFLGLSLPQNWSSSTWKLSDLMETMVHWEAKLQHSRDWYDYTLQRKMPWTRSTLRVAALPLPGHQITSLERLFLWGNHYITRMKRYLEMPDSCLQETH